MTYHFLSIPLILLVFGSYLNASTDSKIQDTQAQIQKLQEQLVALQKLQVLEAKAPQSLQGKKALTQAKQDKENKLKTHAELGFVSTSGNTDTNAYNLDMKMKKGWGKHLLEYSFDGQYADDNNIETKNKFLTELQYDYQISQRFSFDYLSGYKKDKFSGYNYQFYTGPGAKYKVIQEEKHKLSLEGNILYAQDELDTGLQTNYTSIRAKSVYAWQILSTLKFTQDLSYRSELEATKNYFLFSKTALVSKISDIFSLGINYKVDYANIAPLGKQSTDKTLSASLIIDY